MIVLDKGHRYELAHRGGEGTTIVQYVNREPGHECEGVITQEILRMLIDHTRYCNNCLPHPNNARIIKHFELALVLHEARALERKVEKGEIAADYIAVGEDGHFEISEAAMENRGQVTRHLLPWVPDWERVCNHREPPAPKTETVGPGATLPPVQRRVPYPSTEPYLGHDFP